jgi:hypothetical protein
MEAVKEQPINEEVNKVTTEELKQLQELNQLFQTYKTQLGDLEVKKSLVIAEVNKLRADFTTLETSLMEKYGKDCVINIETGEIKEKENG